MAAEDPAQLGLGGVNGWPVVAVVVLVAQDDESVFRALDFLLHYGRRHRVELWNDRLFGGEPPRRDMGERCWIFGMNGTSNVITVALTNKFADVSRSPVNHLIIVAALGRGEINSGTVTVVVAP